MFRRGVVLAVALVALAASTGWAAHPPSGQGLSLAQALADKDRDAQRGADARRHPAELVALARIRPGQRVLDLIPGNGYWTRIFSKMVGPGGKVYAVWPKAYAQEAGSDVKALQQLSTSPAYANVVNIVEPTAELTAPEPLDVVWTSQNFHDYNDAFMGKPGPKAFVDAAWRALKPGGRLVVIDHATLKGRGLQDTETLHRIDRAAVIEEATAGGFRLAGESNALRNPADPKTIPVFDKSIRGRTDQFALVFVKVARKHGGRA
jgi:predicted methyltransferase